MGDMRGDGQTRLPGKARLSATEFVDSRSLPKLLAFGLAAYLCVILATTAVQAVLIRAGHPVVASGGVVVDGLTSLLYFNVVTVLTIGYGDVTPIGWGRLLACIEALAGVGLFGALVSVGVLKLTLPRKSSIVFSRHCYFTLDDMRFVVLFVNATKTRLVNADMCSVLKIGGANWIVRPSYRAPYVGGSVWTFSVNSMAEYVDLGREGGLDLSELDFYPGDGMKFGISGSLGFTTFSASKNYAFSDCWVIKTKAELPLETLKEPRWGDAEFEAAFHFRPAEEVTFLDFARYHGARIQDEQYDIT